MGMPLWKAQISFGIYSLSFIIRATFNILALFDSKSITDLQTNSCLNCNGHWAFLIFFIAFFGEVLPLTLLYFMLIVSSKIDI